MPHKIHISAIMLIAILSLCQLTSAKIPPAIPEQDYTVWGQVYFKDPQKTDLIPLTKQNTEYAISLKIGDETLASYPMGSNQNFGDNYVLKVPMALGNAQHKAKAGDLVSIYINNLPVSEAFLEPDHIPVTFPYAIIKSGLTISISLFLVVDQTPPYIANQLPMPDSTVNRDTDIYLEIKDDGKGVDQNSIQMTVEGNIVQPTITAIQGGYSLSYKPLSKFLPDQVVDVTISASDLASPPNIISPIYAYHFLAKNRLPIVANLSTTPSDPKTGTPLECSYTYTDADGDIENGTEIRWYKDEIYQSSYKNKTVVSSGSVKKGQTWYVTIKSRDGYEYGELVKSSSVIVGNTPPIADNLKITPIDPLTEDELTCGYDFNDIDGDTESGTEIRWFRNGLEETQYLGQVSIPPSATSKGDRWYFTIKPKDGTEFGEQKTSLEAIIGNTPPIAGNVQITPSNPQEGVLLTCNYDYFDADGDLESGTTLRWYRNESLQDKYNDQKIVPSGVIKKDEQWKVIIRPNDGISQGKYQTSPIVTIGNTPPNTDGLVIEIEPSGDLMAKYTYTDPNGDIEDGTEIRWYKNGMPEPNLNDHLVVPFNLTLVGEKWHFTVKPKDGLDFGSLKTSPEVTIGNIPPLAESLLIAPSSPSSGDSLTGSYAYSDGNGDVENGTEIKWYKNEIEQVQYSGQKVVPPEATGRGERWYFTVRPKDGTDFGALKMSPEVSIANIPPIAKDIILTPSAPKTGTPLECSYTYTDADGDIENGTEIRWYKDEVYQSSYKNKTVVSSGSVKKGQTWYVTIKPKDGLDFGELVKSSSITIANMPPTADSAKITPSEPITDDDLICGYDYEDADKDIESGTEILWYKNNSLQTDLTNQTTISADNTAKNDKWFFTVKPKDGVEFGDMATSTEMIIGNTAPTVSNVNITPTEPYDDGKLTCSYDYYDADNDKESETTLRWYRNDSLQEKYNESKTIPIGVIKKNEKWRVVVRPGDGTELGKYETSQTVTILNTPPSVTDLMIQIAPNGDLTAKYTYTDASKDLEESSEIRWYKNGQLLSSLNNQKTVPAIETSKGERWYFTVKPKDGSEFGKQKSSPEVVIGNKPPIASKLLINPSSPLTTDELICKYEYEDENGDLEYGTEIKWYKNGEEQTQFIYKKTIPSNITTKGDKWHFTVKPSDGTDFGELKKSSEVIIDNTPPIVKDIAINPQNPKTDNMLECKYTYADIDEDAENGTEIKWYKDDVYQSAYKNKAIVPADYAKKGQVWYVTIKPKDGSDFGELVKSTSVNIGNMLPIADDLAIKPSSPKLGNDLTCEYAYTDLDDDKEKGTEIRWYKNGVVQQNLNDQLAVKFDLISKGEKWHFTVKPKDGDDFGELKTSSDVSIDNTLPIASKLMITPSSPLTTDDLTCKYEYEDENGDKESGTEIKWFKNGEDQILLMGQKTISSNATAKGEKWHFTIKPKDGMSFGELKTSLDVVIGNVPPIAKDIIITPSNPKIGDSLECKYAYTDMDEDTEDGTEIKWYKDDVYQGSYRDKTTNSVKKSQVWYVTIKPSDGDDFGELVKSRSVTIGNTSPIADDLKINPPSPKIVDDLTCEYTYTDPDDDLEKGTEISWYKDGVIQQFFSDKSRIPSDSISKGDKWHFTIKPNDGDDSGELKTSSSVTVGNTAPIVDNLAIIPTSPKAGDSLECKYVYTDIDDDKENGSEIKWFKDEIEQTQYTGQTTIPQNITAKGEKWHFSVKPKDGISFGELKTSLIVIVGNTLPVADFLLITTENHRAGEPIKCSYKYSDADGDLEDGTDLRWYKDDIEQTQYAGQQNISPNSSKGEQWYFAVKPKDGKDYGELKKSSEIVIGNTPPVADKPVISSSNPLKSDALICEYEYKDKDNDQENGTEIKWFKDGIEQAQYKGQKSIDSISKGEKWHFTIKPKDGTDFGDMKASSEVIVGNIPPIVGDILIKPSEPKAGDSLKCIYTYTDADNDIEDGTEIKWYKDDFYQSNYKNKTAILSDSVKKGQIWYVAIRPKDGTEFGEGQQSSSVIVINTAPIADDLKIEPPNPLTNDDLVCSYSYNDVDDDTEDGTEIRWFKNDVEQDFLNNQIGVPNIKTAKGDKWHFAIRPKDGSDYGEFKVSSIIIIENTPPFAENLIINPAKPTPDDDLVCAYQYGDSDDDMENGTQIKWFKDGDLQAKYNNINTIPSIELESGQTWHFTVQPNDGTQFGEIKISDSIKIGEGIYIPPKNLYLPIATELIISPKEPFTDDDLHANYVYSDLDGDPESGTELKWYKNDVYQKNRDNYATIPAIEVSKGDRWHFTIRPKDGRDFGETKSSAIVIIQNSLPIIKEMSIIPLSPKKTDNLICSYVYSDADNDIEAGTEIKWFRDSQIQHLYNDQRIIPPSELAKGQKWYFSVKPEDSTDFGELKKSDVVTIINSVPTAQNISISPKSPFTEDDIICNYDYVDADNDAELGTEIKWYKDDQIQTVYNDQRKISSTETAKGQKWHFTIRPRDGFAFGDIQKSEILTIIDTSPVITDLRITPSSPAKIDNLLSHYNYNDPDFDTEIGTEIKWLKNGTPQAEFDNQRTILSDNIKKGDKWNFRIRTRHNNGWTDWQESAIVIVRNTPPVAIIKSDSQIIAVNSPAKFLASESFDADGDTLSYRWDFNANDGISTDSSEREISYIYDKSGEYVITLIVNDGEADSISAIFNLMVDNRSVLLSATYDIPDEKLILKFNKRLNPEIARFDGKNVCMEIADSGKADLLISGELQPIVNWSSSSEVIIDMSNSLSTAFNLVLEGVVNHHKIDLILPSGLIADSFGIWNQAVLGSDDVAIEMVSDRFRIGVVGDVNGSGTITNYDAELMLESIVNGANTLPIYNSAMEVSRWLAKHEYSFNAIMDIADIDRDGLLTSYDASLIMQKALKPIPENISDNQQTFRRAKMKINQIEHQELDTTISLNNAIGVYSADITIAYNPQELALKSISKSSETSQWLLAQAITEPGKLKIAMAGISQPVDGNDLVNIRFDSLIGEINNMPTIASIQLNGQKFGVVIEEIPKQTLLLQNYPNPCKDETWIPYQISSESIVSINIYDQSGNLVRRVYAGEKSPGIYVDMERSAHWDCKNEYGEKVSSGIYFCVFQAGNYSSIKKIVVSNF